MTTSDTTVLTAKQRARIEKLMPGGVPKYVRIYDNVDESTDHITVVFTGNYRTQGLKRGERPTMQHLVIGMSSAPWHPQGVCMHVEYNEVIDAPNGWAPTIGRKCHLGTRIPFLTLNSDCRKVVIENYCVLWDLPFA